MKSIQLVLIMISFIKPSILIDNDVILSIEELYNCLKDANINHFIINKNENRSFTLAFVDELNKWTNSIANDKIQNEELNSSSPLGLLDTRLILINQIKENMSTYICNKFEKHSDKYYKDIYTNCAEKVYVCAMSYINSIKRYTESCRKKDESNVLTKTINTINYNTINSQAGQIINNTAVNTLKNIGNISKRFWM
ncbi:uncharacterized protein LOC126899678 [Daktulosphaira vitifoliae]|uniref:uncharacterized protein LOC126899678 n=1 Tax=Daktulosphaira vitifoliae TaxID=58002 RepID=UPI0021AB09DB|nr:uncharacterized protein LOC126899678 [Daktulosphaira vitifoliae]